MQRACARAVEIGWSGPAFTEHVDFMQWSEQDAAELASESKIAQPARIGARPPWTSRATSPIWRAVARSFPICALKDAGACLARPYMGNGLPRSLDALRLKNGHESETTRAGHNVRRVASVQFSAPHVDIRFEKLQLMMSR